MSICLNSLCSFLLLTSGFIVAVDKSAVIGSTAVLSTISRMLAISISARLVSAMIVSA